MTSASMDIHAPPEPGGHHDSPSRESRGLEGSWVQAWCSAPLPPFPPCAAVGLRSDPGDRRGCFRPQGRGRGWLGASRTSRGRIRCPMRQRTFTMGWRPQGAGHGSDCRIWSRCCPRHTGPPWTAAPSCCCRWYAGCGRRRRRAFYPGRCSLKCWTLEKMLRNYLLRTSINS